jgi:hypothetical protein
MTHHQDDAASVTISNRNQIDFIQQTKSEILPRPVVRLPRSPEKPYCRVLSESEAEALADEG